jgi:Protein of unknown function (DUF1566)
LFFCVALSLIVLSASDVQAQETQPGDVCTAGELNYSIWTAGPENTGTGNFLVCDGAAWQPVLRYSAAGLVSIRSAATSAVTLSLGGSDALQLTSGTTAQRPGTPAGGMFRYNTTTTPADTLEYYDAETAAWLTLSSAASGGAALSSLTDATATNTIDSDNFAQVWNWSTLSTETALSLASSSQTTGSLLTLTGSNNNAASTGAVAKLNVTGASNAAVPLMVTNLGTGLTARFNDETGDADMSPTVIDASGNLGVGAAPVTGISIDAGARTDSIRPAVGTTAQQPTCDNTTEGAVRYDTDLSTLTMCNGTDWVLIASSTCDNAPAYFAFTALTAQAPATLLTSNIVAITGMDAGCSASVSIAGSGTPEYRICSTSNCSSVDVNWTTGNSTIAMQGKFLQLRTSSSASAGATVTATGTIGPVDSIWSVTTASSDCSLDPIGTVCGDGSVYAGTSSAGGAMFVTRCDAGQTWSGSACTGARSGSTWNDSSGNWVDTSLVNCGTAGACLTDGEANTSSLIYEDSNYVTAGTQNHVAAQYCADLSIHSQTDWYLPSIAELDVVNTNKTAIGNLLTDGNRYTSSSERDSIYNWWIRFNDGAISIDGKNNGYYVRCARRNADVTPDAFSFTDQTGLTAASLVTSNILQINGMDTSTRVHATSKYGEPLPEIQICSDAACSSVVTGWTSGETAISSGQYLQLRTYAATEGGATRNIYVTVGASAADQWSLVTAAGDPCSGSPSPGAVCSDGSVYAGNTPDGSVPMYVTRCDAGQTWNGTICSGARSGPSWNDSSANWVDTSLVNCGTAPACAVTGETNTTTLIAADSNSVLGGIQIHAAAQLCADLNIHGQTDWYLPSIAELDVLNTSKTAIGNLLLDGNRYTSSSERDSIYNWWLRFNDGAISIEGKNNGYYVRCSRK